MDRLPCRPLNLRHDQHTNGKERNTILVIGSTGKTGKRVADQLENRGIPVRQGSRSSDIPFDWEEPQTWAPALAGVDKAYLTYYPDLAVPGSVDAMRKLTDLAKDAGVNRLVLLAGRGEEEAERAEDLVKESGLEWTIVRPSFFAQNFSEGAWLDDVISGTVAFPIGDVREPFVDADDIADVAVAALTDDRHIGQTYELTGPRLLSFGDAVAEIAEASGRDLTFVSLPMDDYVATLNEYGLPEDFIWLLQYLFTDVLDDRCPAGRRCAACPGTRAERLRRVRSRGRGDRRVDAGVGGGHRWREPPMRASPGVRSRTRHAGGVHEAARSAIQLSSARGSLFARTARCRTGRRPPRGNRESRTHSRVRASAPVSRRPVPVCPWRIRVP